MKSKKQILAACLAACMAIGCGSWATAVVAGPLLASKYQVTVNGVNVSEHEDATRLVLELSGTPQYAVFTLSQPDRLVIDIVAAQLDDVRPLFVQQGLIKRLRAGLRDDGKLRIVADLTRPVVAREQVVASGDVQDARIVIDLQSAKASRVIRSADSRVPSKSSEPPVAPPAPVKVAEARVRQVVVAVDPGHGGQDPGALGRSAREKEVTLAIAQKLAAQINRDPGMRAVLTRSTDEFVSLRERIQRARRAQADIFVSIHADAYKDKSVQGSSVYVLSSKGASDEASLWLAKSENAADLIGGISLEDKNDVLASVLFDLSQGASMSASVEAADKVLRELDRVGNVHRPAVQFAGFVVLKSPDIPSMLVETAFITNPGEEAKLTNPEHQEELASAIHAGVRRYFETNPPLGSRFAEARRKLEDKPMMAKREPEEEGMGNPRGVRR